MIETLTNTYFIFGQLCCLLIIASVIALPLTTLTSLYCELAAVVDVASDKLLKFSSDGINAVLFFTILILCWILFLAVTYYIWPIVLLITLIRIKHL